MTVWKKAEKLFETVPKFHKLSPLWNNTNILTGKKPFTCPLWAAKGICTLGDIYSKDGLYSFNNLQTLFDIPGSSFFLYLRLRSAMKAYGVPWNTLLPSHPLAGFFDPGKESRGLVSQIYNSLLKTQCKRLPIEVVWEKDLEQAGLRPDWLTVWSNMSETSRNWSHQLIHFKTIHRAYATPYRRYRMGLISDPNCTICQRSVTGTMYHMFWECSVINHFWTQVCRDLEELIDRKITPDPCLCLLNDVSSLNLGTVDKRILFSGFTAAKKSIITLWWDTKADISRLWLLNMQQIVTMECSLARFNKAKPRMVQAWQRAVKSIGDLF